MTYNAANRKDVRRREKQARLSEVARRETLRTLMSTMAGREWVYELLAIHCHVFNSSFMQGHYISDPHATMFMEGERSVGLHILEDINAAAADEYVLMMREEHVRHSTADARERTDSEDGDGGDQEPDSFADSPDAA